VSFQRGKPLPALYVRKAQKDHGTAKLVEGDKSIRPGMPVALLEDVITTGGSSLRAVKSLQAVGVKVVGIVALVDRLEGGRETIEAEKLPLFSLATRRISWTTNDRGYARPLEMGVVWEEGLRPRRSPPAKELTAFGGL